MARRTKNPATAVPRAAALLGVKCRRSRKGGKWLLQVPGDKLPPVPRSSWHALAHLAFTMRRQGVSPEPVAYTGDVPLRGLAGWEERSIKWLSGSREAQ